MYCKPFVFVFVCFIRRRNVTDTLPGALKPKVRFNAKNKEWVDLNSGPMGFVQVTGMNSVNKVKPSTLMKYEVGNNANLRWKHFLQKATILDLTRDPEWSACPVVVNRTQKWGPKIKETEDASPGPLRHLGLMLRKVNRSTGTVTQPWSLLLSFTCVDFRCFRNKDTNSMVAVFHNYSPLAPIGMEESLQVVLVPAVSVVWKDDLEGVASAKTDTHNGPTDKFHGLLPSPIELG